MNVPRHGNRGTADDVGEGVPPRQEQGFFNQISNAKRVEARQRPNVEAEDGLFMNHLENANGLKVS